MRANDDPNFESGVAHLKSQGIGFKVCANTLKGRKISYEDDLYDVDQEDIVPSGVAELAHLQAEGYSYVKPRVANGARERPAHLGPSHTRAPRFPVSYCSRQRLVRVRSRRPRATFSARCD